MVAPPFCIDARVLGTTRHLACSHEGFAWRSTVPERTWHLSGVIKPDSDWCLDSLLRLARVDVGLVPPAAHVNAMSAVAPELDVIPWAYAMAPKAHRAFTEGIINDVVETIDRLPVDYYRGTWVPGNAVIRSLQRASIDVGRWQALVDARVGNVAVVETFRPGSDGIAEAITYDRFGSLTGRLTVTRGPSILTLNRDYRDLLVPSSPGGHIVSIDFAALEVRVLLYEAGRSCTDHDLYGMIARDLGYERKAVKGAVISELYGSSKQALGRALGIDGDELMTFVRKVRTYFNTPQLLKRIKAQFYETGAVINRYGRPVKISDPLDHIFINYYAQSTGVDVTLTGFSQIVGRLSREAPGVRPLFLLHDALILDVPAVHLDLVSSLTSVRVPGYVQAYPLKIERLLH